MKISTHAAIFSVSVAFLLIFSTSTSPLYESWGDDSSIFQAVGKGWAEGYLPYVDLFENKGALIFAIDALGYMICPRVGIFLLQIPAMYLSMLFAWWSLGIFLPKTQKLAVSAFMLAFYGFYMLDGNRTEEWSMPFLMASTYLFLRGIKEKNFPCPPRVGFIYGLGFGACVLLRTTNALPICCYAFLSAIFLLRDGEVKIFLRNAVNFCAGAIIIVLPFGIYFAAQNSLYEMLYGTILLNVAYSAQRGNFLLTHLDEYAGYVAVHFLPMCLMIVVSAIEFLKSRSRLAMSGIFCGAAMLVLLFKLSPYLGYCALILPLFPLNFAVFAAFAEKFRAWRSAKNLLSRALCDTLIVLLAAYPLIIFYEAGLKVFNENSADVRKYHAEQNAEMLKLAELIPPAERSSVMFWSEGTHASHWILTTGIFPRCRFFGNTKAFANVDENVKREWLENARADFPKWIIYSAPEKEFAEEEMEPWMEFFRINRDVDVERLLRERYNLAGEMETYLDSLRLYRLKEQ